MENRIYNCLTQQEFVNGIYKLIPIRDEDKYDIMQWRNDQIDILRQKELLTKEKQEWYFENVVANLFKEEKPNQLLFSFLENDQLIGYGGLVHIDWESGNGEISFITPILRANDENLFESDWNNYLVLLKKVAKDLNFRKINTYAYGTRTNLFPILINNKFEEEAVLKKHILINNTMEDVIIHSYFI